MNSSEASDPRAELLQLYQQWKSLTEAEGAAILSSDWPTVRRCQKNKELLQPKIIHLTGQTRSLAGGGLNFEAQIRELVNELIQLETKNSATLGQRLETAERERSELDRTSQRLRQVHKSYVPSQAPVWNQYS